MQGVCVWLLWVLKFVQDSPVAACVDCAVDYREGVFRRAPSRPAFSVTMCLLEHIMSPSCLHSWVFLLGKQEGMSMPRFPSDKQL